MDIETKLTFTSPGREPVETTMGVLEQRLRDLTDRETEEGEDLGYSDDDALSLAQAARMKAGYTFAANHTGKAKLSTDKLGRRVLTVAFSVTSRRKDFPQVASRIMEMLADVSEHDEVSVTVRPVVQQLPLM